MNNDDKLQIPINGRLKKDFKDKCQSLGFSSLNEAVRVMVHNFTYSNTILQFMPSNKANFYIAPYSEDLDSETEKKISKAYKSFEAGDCSEINLKNKDWIEELED